MYLRYYYMGYKLAELVGECTWAFGYILPAGKQVRVLCSHARTRFTRWVKVFAQ
jgi:hypothetical protein